MIVMIIQTCIEGELSPLLLVVALWSLLCSSGAAGLPLMLWREVPPTGRMIGMVLRTSGDGMAVSMLLGAQLLAVLCRSFLAKNHTCHPCALAVTINYPHWHIKTSTNQREQA